MESVISKDQRLPVNFGYATCLALLQQMVYKNCSGIILLYLMNWRFWQLLVYIDLLSKHLMMFIDLQH
jgi:hypothetical protein